MNILVTGADGFIGKRMAEALQKQGHHVIKHVFMDGDLSKKESLAPYDHCAVDMVYHFAARTFVPDSWSDSYEYFHTNVMGTVSVLEYCRKKRCSAVLMSSYVYGEPQFLPVTEEHPVAAVTPYHETKVVTEHIGKFYSEQFSLPVTVFRPFNVYGMGQKETFLLPKVMKQLLDKQIERIELMDLTPRRDYVYIKDVAEALCCAMAVREGFHVYNIGTGRSYSVEEAVKICMEVTGIEKPIVTKQNVRAFEVSDCVADISKLRHDFGYQVRYSLPEGIRDWYLEIQKWM